MQLTVAEIAIILKGKVEGNAASIITHPAKITDAQAGAITFLANPKYEIYVSTTNASAILVSENYKPTRDITATLIRVKDVYSAVSQLLHYYEQSAQLETSISELAFIHPEASVEQSVSVGAFTVISEKATIRQNCRIYPQVFIGKNVVIGDNTLIYPGVRIYHNCQIGNNCIIHANAVIGSDGFGFAPKGDGSYQKIPQVGNVRLEANVEIGANTVIDRATMGSTLIKQGTKLDNLIQIAHNVTVGENTVIAAQAGVAGSTAIGNQCQIGGQAGFVGHIEIADGVKVQAQSGVAASIKKAGSKVYGYPALSYQDYLRAYTLFKQLPALEKRIRELEKKNSE